MIELKLNDFASFDRRIFKGVKPILFTRRTWKSFSEHCYDKATDTITFPIDHKPTTIEEHQFCHYVLWMTIWANKLRSKPRRFCYIDAHGYVKPLHIVCDCFACHYKTKDKCPIKDWQPCKCLSTGTLYVNWEAYKDNENAYGIAHKKWEEVNN